ncbi:hypothetical protein TYRP_003244 [Tyrophagus putrescentiae]|nr:hypothetical protein TYRP_003244 [Tyrophagus putrescentiae]
MPGPLKNGRYEVEDILSKRLNSETNVLEYKVKWVGWPSNWNTCLSRWPTSPARGRSSRSLRNASSSEGGEAAEALDAREAVAAAEVEVMEVVVEPPEVMETVAAAEALKVAPEEIMDICNLNPVNLCPAGFQRPSKIEGDRTLRSTMALVNLPNELDKLYRAPSKKRTAAEKHLTGDDRGQAERSRLHRLCTGRLVWQCCSHYQAILPSNSFTAFGWALLLVMTLWRQCPLRKRTFYFDSTDIYFVRVRAHFRRPSFSPSPRLTC